MATTQEVNDFMMTNLKFIPRMYQVINQVAPDAGMATGSPRPSSGPRTSCYWWTMARCTPPSSGWNERG